MNDANRTLDELEARLAQDGMDWAEGLSDAGILACCGRENALRRLAGRARAENLDADGRALAALRACDQTLDTATGADLGLAVCRTQGLLLAVHGLHLMLPLPLAMEAAHDLAEHALATLLDAEAVAAIEDWGARCGLVSAAAEARILPVVRAPVPELEWLLAAPQPGRRAAAVLTPESDEAWMRQVAECFEYAQRGDRPPEKLRERLNTARTPIEALYGGGRLTVRRNLSDRWLLTLNIEASVPVAAVRWGRRPFLPHEKDTSLWTLDLAPAARDDREELGTLAVDILFADGNRLKVR